MPQSLTSLEVGLPTLHHWAPGICPEPASHASHRASAPAAGAHRWAGCRPRTLQAQRRHWGRGAGWGRG